MISVFIKNKITPFETSRDFIDLPLWIFDEISETVKEQRKTIVVYDYYSSNPTFRTMGRKFFDYIVGLLDPETQEETWENIPWSDRKELPTAIRYYLKDKNPFKPTHPGYVIWHPVMVFVQSKLEQPKGTFSDNPYGSCRNTILDNPEKISIMKKINDHYRSRADNYKKAHPEVNWSGSEDSLDQEHSSDQDDQE